MYEGTKTNISALINTWRTKNNSSSSSSTVFQFVLDVRKYNTTEIFTLSLMDLREVGSKSAC